MFKICTLLCFLVFAGFNLAWADKGGKCAGCLGTKLVKLTKKMHTEENCWFSPEHHYMVKFKDQMMSILYEEFDKLYKSAIEEVSDECKRTVDLKPCTIITDEVHQDDQAVCYIENSKAYAFAFNEMEACSKHALSETQSKLLYMLMDGILSGWHKIHTSC